MRSLVTFLLCLSSFLVHSQDTLFLKVHFLYGSRPLRKYRDTESKWFGGMLGGHVGIEGDSDRVVNFTPHGKFHLFAHARDKHSTYTVHTVQSFYAIMGGDPDSMKEAIVYVPVSREQKARFDSVTAVYLKETPYDYALFGMRCGAAAYDVLGRVGILPAHSYRWTWRTIFYPKKLRKRLLKKAKAGGWRIDRQPGTIRRKWERD